MSVTLYHGEPNGASLTVLAMLFEKGIDAELVRIDLAAGERHHLPFADHPQVAMSIEGEGPVLVVDGEPMTDSSFIAAYLDTVGGGPPLRPPEPYARWQTMMHSRRFTERVVPAAAYLGCRAHLHPVLAAMNDADFAAITDRIASVDLKQRWVEIREGNFLPAQIADSTDKLRADAETAEAQIPDDAADWLLGDFSMIDIESYAWLAGMIDLVPDAYAGAPKYVAYLERVAKRPSIQRALSLATAHDPRKVWAPGPEINRWG